MAGFLKLERIKGDAVAAGHEGWIEVTGVNLGGQHQGAHGTGTSRGLTDRSQTTVAFVASVGSHSSDLNKALVQGTHHDAEVALTGARGHYATVRMSRALVTSYVVSDGGGPDRSGTETFSLVSETPFKWELTPQAALPGRWLVTVGSWTGYFVFEGMGTVYWTERNGTARHNGVWKITATDVQWRFAGAGDIRTFVIPVPITSDSIGGKILPAGQGFFTMKRE